MLLEGLYARHTRMRSTSRQPEEGHHKQREHHREGGGVERERGGVEDAPPCNNIEGQWEILIQITIDVQSGYQNIRIKIRMSFHETIFQTFTCQQIEYLYKVRLYK